jgi:uncharacterized protein YecE (DUF72 family)
MRHFTETLGLLKEKVGPLVVQLPPSFKNPKHLKALQGFIESLDNKLRFAVEFRHESWFDPKVAKLLAAYDVCQVWSVNQYLTTPATVTSDYLYLRLVGDRAITEFSKLQKDQGEAMKTWSKNLREAGGSVNDRFVFFNNHFAGFGPASVNEFRRLMGLVEMDWSGLGQRSDAPQKTLFDFSQTK